VTRDLSAVGFGLLHTKLLQAKSLRGTIQTTDEDKPLTIEVLLKPPFWEKM